jgi:hypothetical protein
MKAGSEMETSLIADAEDSPRAQAQIDPASRAVDFGYKA